MRVIFDAQTGTYWAASPVSAREVDVWRLAGRPPETVDFPVLRSLLGLRRTLRRLGYRQVNWVPEPIPPDYLRYLAEL